VTLAGTVAVSLLLVSVTTAPSVGAAAVNVTVAVTGKPLATAVADNETPLKAAAVVAVGDDGDDPHAATIVAAAIAAAGEMW